MSDVAVVIGHHRHSPGATLTVGTHTVTEYGLWKPFAFELTRTLTASGLDPRVVERPKPDPSSVVPKINETGADAAIELHFNAAGDSRAAGAEMLHYESSGPGQRLAKTLLQNTVDALGVPRRGLLPAKEYPVLRDTTMPAVIAEPFFGSHPGDVERALPRLPSLMRAYRDAIQTFLGVS